MTAGETLEVLDAHLGGLEGCETLTREGKIELLDDPSRKRCVLDGGSIETHVLLLDCRGVLS